MSQKIRQGNDIDIRWSLLDGDEQPYDLTGKDIAVELNVGTKKVRIKEFDVSGNTLHFIYYGKDQKYLGSYALKYIENGDKPEMITFDTKDAFALVEHSWLAVDEGETPETIQLEVVTVSSELDMKTGPRGYSAYEIAVQEGFVGTEEEWLASLKGEQGEPGTTDYNELENKPDLSQFITKTVNDLTNYYLKSETYTKAEVLALIAAIQQFHFEVYASLEDVTSPAGNVLYLIGPTGSGADKYEEYVYSNGQFIKIGDTTIDLSGYVTTQQLNSALATKQDKAVAFTVQPDKYLTFPASQMSLAVIIEHKDNVLPPIFVTGDNYERFFVSAVEGWAIPVSFVSGTIEDGQPVLAIHNGFDEEEQAIPVVVKVVSLTGDDLPNIFISEEGGFDEEPTPFPVRYLYAKPAEGIPASDMASGVQTSLDKADTALQPVSGATNGNLAGLNSQGKVVDSGKKIVTSWDNPPLDTNIPNEKLVYDSLYKRGVISQTQTWTRAADGGYDYVMSDLVYGNIPRANIDLFVAAGAVFNETSGYFELNELTDISYEEMQKIYGQYTPNPWTSQMPLAFVGIRTNITPANRLPNYVVQTGVRLCYESFDLERVSVISENYVAKFNSLQFAFYYLERLNTINGVLDVSGMTAFTLVFTGDKSLESVQVKTLKASVSFSDSPRLSNASILYMINNEAATSAITITLHATAYARATADADITAALANHPNVSLASA